MLLRSSALAAALAVLIVLGAGPTATGPHAFAQGETQGDVNCDAAVNSIDSLQILRPVAGLTNTTPDGCVPIGEETEIAPNSYQLIQAALEGGDIGPETALMY